MATASPLFDAETDDEDIYSTAAADTAWPESPLQFKAVQHGWTALQWASCDARVDVVRVAMQRGPSFESLQQDEGTPLMQAARDGHLLVVLALLQSGAPIEAKAPSGCTALMWAAFQGHTRIVAELIGQGADVNVSNAHGWTALMWAVRNGHQETAELLLQQEASVNAVNKDGWSALMLAARAGHTEIVGSLLTTRSKQPLSLDASNSSGWTALMLAASNGFIRAAMALLDHGAGLDLINEEGFTALALAAQNGHLAMARVLLDKGAQVDARNETKCCWTPLMVASFHGQTSIVTLLLQRGALVDAVACDGWRALMLASQKGNAAIVRLLLNRGTSVNAIKKNGWSALMIAAFHGHDEVVTLLAQRGATMDAGNDEGWSALMFAAGKGHTNCIHALIRRGALVDARNKQNGRTALMAAAQNGHLRALEALIHHGAAVNTSSFENWTPLMLTALLGRTALASVLIKEGAHVNEMNAEKRTALMIATSEQYLDVVQVLIEHGATPDARDKAGWTALMFAAQNGDADLVRILMERSAIDDVMRLFRAGIRHHESSRLLPTPLPSDELLSENKAAAAEVVTLESVAALSSGMHEAQPMCDHICVRLVDLEKNAHDVYRELFQRLLERVHLFLLAYAHKLLITRIVSCRMVIETCGELHRQIDTLLHDINPAYQAEHTIHDWQQSWEREAKAQQNVFQQVPKVSLVDELQDPIAQTEALTLLLFECNSRQAKYTTEELTWIHSLFQHVASLSNLVVPLVPEWFIPPHEVEFDTRSPFARGSYASVYRGMWVRTPVVVKSLLLVGNEKDEQSRLMFRREADLWSQLQHLHVVRLFGACHVGNPFFVCEDALNGTLLNYLHAQKRRHGVHEPVLWRKLHEVALGLQYLHKKHVVHGDLKCNNMVVAKDGTAKIIDFGLSFMLLPSSDEHTNAESIDTNELGAIRWKAPEVLAGETRGSYASDIYSFGMCIIEAVTGNVPWGMMPDVTVKYKVLTMQETLPRRPMHMTDPQWDLVSAMCAFNPARRPDITQVEERLQLIAEKELDDHWNAEWERQDNNQDSLSTGTVSSASSGS